MLEKKSNNYPETYVKTQNIRILWIADSDEDVCSLNGDKSQGT